MKSNRIAIFSPYFFLTRGGHEVCTAVTIEALNRIGVVPDLHGVPPSTPDLQTAKKEIETTFGMKLDFNPRFLISEMFAIKGMTTRYRDVTFFQALPTILGRYDWIYDFSLGLPLASNRGSYLAYWNLNEDVLGGFQNILAGRHPRTTPLLSRLVASRRRRLLRNGSYHVVVNSSYSASLARMFLPGEAQVVYPPVRVRLFEGARTSHRSGVVMWGRFDPLKRQLGAVKLLEAINEGVGDVPLTLCGSTRGAKEYYGTIERYVSDRGLSFVRLLPDPTFEEALTVLGRALVYLHMAENETFGISTAEAIAAGCIPIVHDSGGQREIVSTPELRFSTAEHLQRVLSDCLSAPDKYEEALSRLRDHVRSFSDRIFSGRLLHFAGLASNHDALESGANQSL